MHYEGKCHCGKIKFSFESEPITTAKRCNCSICKRKGAVMSTQYIPGKDFHPHENAADMEDYRWQDRDVNHLFCKTCGIYPYHGNNEWGYRVNLGCVDAVDIFALDISIIDGKSM